MSRSFWMNRVADGIAGASEAMFPVNDLGAPDWRQTQMVERTLDYLSEVPPRMRRLVYLMYVAIELLAPLLFVGFGRFSRIGIERRARALQRWRHSALPHHRMLSDALKAQLCMMYLSHPAVQAHIGAFKSCARVADPLGLPVRTDVFSADTPDGLNPEVAL